MTIKESAFSTPLWMQYNLAEETQYELKEKAKDLPRDGNEICITYDQAKKNYYG